MYTHHLLVVVEPIDDTHVMVIHKVDGEEKKTIFEEEKCYEPSDVSVMEYDCQYTGEEAIRRARERMEEGEEYNVVTSNCEHFVTEARTGEKQCLQKKGAIVGGISGGATGAAVGAGAGASAGALIGGVLGVSYSIRWATDRGWDWFPNWRSGRGVSWWRCWWSSRRVRRNEMGQQSIRGD